VTFALTRARVSARIKYHQPRTFEIAPESAMSIRKRVWASEKRRVYRRLVLDGLFLIGLAFYLIVNN